LSNWRNEFLSQANPSDPESFSFVVIGNKVDKESERRVTKANATQWCKTLSAKNPIPNFEASAKDNTMVERAFLEAAQMAVRNREVENKEVIIPDFVVLGKNNNSPPPKSNGCC
jgi:Ras-related protein Rab-7A